MSHPKVVEVALQIPVPSLILVDGISTLPRESFVGGFVPEVQIGFDSVNMPSPTSILPRTSGAPP
jgi:hypothetical protein